MSRTADGSAMFGTAQTMVWTLWGASWVPQVQVDIGELEDSPMQVNWMAKKWEQLPPSKS